MYICSTRQSSKELSDCRVSLVAFLKEYHHHIYNPTPQGLVSTCHTLCMLTRLVDTPLGPHPHISTFSTCHTPRASPLTLPPISNYHTPLGLTIRN